VNGAETCDGAAWVSLVPFFMRVTTPRGGVGVPWANYFCETNVRTYVRDGLGWPGTGRRHLSARSGVGSLPLRLSIS
jgi:uncharacterized protein YqjF (DUF2071 family)